MVNVAHAANFSVPGSGKTSIVLSSFRILKRKNEINKLIVIGPRSSFMSWEEEYIACFKQKLNNIRMVGTKTTRRKLYRDADSKEMMLLTFQMAHRDVNELICFLKKHKCCLVIDESHNIKRLNGGEWANAILSLAPYATKRVILTGTPMPNSMYDLWSQMTFLWPNPPLLGSSEQFKNRIENADSKEINEIKTDLYPYYWRIRKKDLKLKKPIYHRFLIKMKPYQKAIYDALAAKVLSELVKAPEERSKLRMWRRSRVIRLLQAASNPSLLAEHSKEFQIPPLDASGLSVDKLIDNYSDYETPAKFDITTDLVLGLLKKNHKVIIWTAFIHNIKTLNNLFKKFNPRVVYGEIPKDENENKYYNREKMIHEFKVSPKHNLLIANPAACAESVSLHKVCFHAIYFDRTFNGAQYMQSLDRIHRIGLEPNDQVHYYMLNSKNTIDETVDQRLTDKHKKMLQLLDDDFSILDLDLSQGEVSEEGEEEADFNSMVNYLKKIYG
jgi:SNF2 family DNA or RNA helicase